MQIPLSRHFHDQVDVDIDNAVTKPKERYPAWEIKNTKLTVKRICELPNMPRILSSRIRLFASNVSSMVPRDLTFVKSRYRSLIKPFDDYPPYLSKKEARDYITMMVKKALAPKEAQARVNAQTMGPEPALIPIRSTEVALRDEKFFIKIARAHGISLDESMETDDNALALSAYNENADSLPPTSNPCGKWVLVHPSLDSDMFEKNNYDIRLQYRMCGPDYKFPIRMLPSEITLLENNFNDTITICGVDKKAMYRVGIGMTAATRTLYVKQPLPQTDPIKFFLDIEPPTTPIERELTPASRDCLHGMKLDKAMIICKYIPWVHVLRFRDEVNVREVEDSREAHVTLKIDQHKAYQLFVDSHEKASAMAYGTFILINNQAQEAQDPEFAVLTNQYLSLLEELHEVTEAIITLLTKNLVTKPIEELERPEDVVWLKLGPNLLQKKRGKVSMSRAMLCYDRYNVQLIKAKDKWTRTRPYYPKDCVDLDGDPYTPGDLSAYTNMHPSGALHRTRGNPLINPTTVNALIGLNYGGFDYAPKNQQNPSVCAACDNNLIYYEHDKQCLYASRKLSDSNVYTNYESTRQRGEYRTEYIRFAEAMKAKILSIEAEFPTDTERLEQRSNQLMLMEKANALHGLYQLRQHRNRIEILMKDVKYNGVNCYLFTAPLPEYADYLTLLPDLRHGTPAVNIVETEEERLAKRRPDELTSWVSLYYGQISAMKRQMTARRDQCQRPETMAVQRWRDPIHLVKVGPQKPVANKRAIESATRLYTAGRSSDGSKRKTGELSDQDSQAKKSKSQTAVPDGNKVADMTPLTKATVEKEPTTDEQEAVGKAIEMEIMGLLHFINKRTHKAALAALDESIESGRPLPEDVVAKMITAAVEADNSRFRHELETELANVMARQYVPFQMKMLDILIGRPDPAIDMLVNDENKADMIILKSFGAEITSSQSFALKLNDLKQKQEGNMKLMCPAIVAAMARDTRRPTDRTSSNKTDRSKSRDPSKTRQRDRKSSSESSSHEKYSKALSYQEKNREKKSNRGGKYTGYRGNKFSSSRSREDFAQPSDSYHYRRPGHSSSAPYRREDRQRNDESDRPSTSRQDDKPSAATSAARDVLDGWFKKRA